MLDTWYSEILESGWCIQYKHNHKCSLPLWRVHEIKRMYLDSRTHGLFITSTQFRLLLRSDIQAIIIYTYAAHDTIISAILPFCYPCYYPLTSPFYSLLLTWKPSFGVMRPCPPWSQDARKLTSPFSSPPHPLPIPNSQHPGQLCASLRRHCDSGFSWSGTIKIPKIFPSD